MKIIDNQSGMVLVMVLIVMVATTIIGVFMMRQSTIETRIAGNERLHNEYFYAAESGVALAVSETSNWAGNPESYQPVNPGDLDVEIDPLGTRRAPDGSGWSVSSIDAEYFKIRSEALDNGPKARVTIGAWKLIPNIK